MCSLEAKIGRRLVGCSPVSELWPCVPVMRGLPTYNMQTCIADTIMCPRRASGLAAVVVVLCAGLAASASHHDPPADESELDRARRQLADAQAELAAAQVQLAKASALEEEQLFVDHLEDEAKPQENRRSAAAVRKLKQLLAAGQQSPPQQSDKQSDDQAKPEKAKPDTSLHKAAFADRHKAMRRLTEVRGVPVDGVDERGRTALHVAAYEGKLEAARVLLELGASVHVADHRGRTALHLAAFADRRLLIKLLRAHGAVGNVKDGLGRTPLRLAAEAAVAKAKKAEKTAREESVS